MNKSSINYLIRSIISFLTGFIIVSVGLIVYDAYNVASTQISDSNPILKKSLWLTMFNSYIKTDLNLIILGTFFGVIAALIFFIIFSKRDLNTTNILVNAIIGGLIGTIASTIIGVFYLFISLIRLGPLALFGILFWVFIIILSGAVSGFIYGLLLNFNILKD